MEIAPQKFVASACIWSRSGFECMSDLRFWELGSLTAYDVDVAFEWSRLACISDG